MDTSENTVQKLPTFSENGKTTVERKLMDFSDHFYYDKKRSKSVEINVNVEF